MSDFWDELMYRDEKFKGVRDVLVLLFFFPSQSMTEYHLVIFTYEKYILVCQANSVSVLAMLQYECTLLIGIVYISFSNIILMFY